MFTALVDRGKMNPTHFGNEASWFSNRAEETSGLSVRTFELGLLWRIMIAMCAIKVRLSEYTCSLII